MRPSNSGLGKGLDALLPDADEAVSEVAIDLIRPAPDQPRRRFPETELLELSQSIRQHGLLQPLVVTPADGDRFHLIAGERRLRASKLAQLSHVPVIVRSTEQQQRFELALIENLQRSDLTPIEEATAFRRLMDEGQLTQEALAKRLGKRRARIAQMVRLLGLSAEMQRSLEAGEITAGHAQALLSHDEPDRAKLFHQIKEQRLNVRQAEAWGPSGTKRAKTAATEKPPWLHQLELAVGLPIERKGTNARGKLVISYHSGEELETLVKKLAGKSDQ